MSSAAAMAAFEALKKRVAAGLAVRTDSRLVKHGDVFVAVPGSKVDGAAFIPMALTKGASFVVATPGASLPDGATAELIFHPDPKAALGELAAAAFGSSSLPFPLAGITGTNGKTTVAYLIEHIIRENGGKPGVLGTVEYRWPGHVELASLTTPDCLKIHEMLGGMARAGVTGAVMEVSSHALDQDRVSCVTFDTAVLTNVTQDHLDYHGGMEGYFQAKTRLFGVYLRDSANAVINFDDPYGRRLLASHPEAMGYGLGDEGIPGRALRGRILSQSGQGMELEMSLGGITWTLTSPMAGQHNASNLLAAQGAALCMGFNPGEMDVLADCHGAPGRLERVANGKGKHVFVDYAHTPDALVNVLKALKALDFERVIAVFGCGGNRDRTKRPLMAEAVAKWADVAVLTSDNPRHEDPLAIMADARPGLAGAAKAMENPDRREAINMALNEAGPRDAVLIAGKGHETYQQIGDVKHPFNDVEVVKELLK